MEDRIREHVIMLFEGVPRTRRSVELMEEMVQDLCDKYADLVGEGKAPDAAYNIVINGIGDVGELISDLEDTNMNDKDFEKARVRSAILTSIAVMMYILCVVPVMLLSDIGDGMLGVIMMFLMIAGATGLIIFNNMTKPRYIKSDDSMVEEFRQFRSEQSGRKETVKAVQSALWAIIVALYFFISFTTSAWHITWIIFLIGAAASNIVGLAMKHYE